MAELNKLITFWLINQENFHMEMKLMEKMHFEVLLFTEVVDEQRMVLV